MRMTIRKKLYGGFSAVLLLLIVISAINFISTNKISNTYMELIEYRTAVVSNIKDLSIAIGNEQASVDHFLLTGDPIYLTAYQNAFNAYKQNSAQIEELLIEDKDSWQVLQGLNLLQNEFVIIADQMIEAKKQEKVEQYTELATSQGALIQKFSQTADKLIQMQQAALDEEIDSTRKTVLASKMFVIILTGLTLLIGLGIAFGISSSISKPILSLSATAGKISSGDLTAEMIEVKTKDEIYDLVNAFEQMTLNLRKVLQEVEGTASQVALSAETLMAGAEETTNATRHVAAITEEVASGAERQVQNVQESVKAVYDMDTQASQIASNAQNVTEMVQQTSQVVSQGNIAVHAAVEQMNAIQHRVTDIAQTVRELGEQSNQIDQIIHFLTDIANQTNLLSLNAAIEAARAGEAGKGFAVVAEEVRKLAEQTADSSKQVSEVIRAILEKTEKTIAAVVEGEKEVEIGIEAVESAGTSFDKIQSSIEGVKRTIEEVSAASENMSQGTEHLVKSFDEIAAISQTTAGGTQSMSASAEQQLATMEEVSNSAVTLSTMAEELLKLIGTFKL
ncbi:MAG: methyl-accepting chemotaxis protein [Thermotaleaceae bacterium]